MYMLGWIHAQVVGDWNFSDWSDSCIRRTPLKCCDKDGFHKYTANKLSATSSSWFEKSIGHRECERLCLKKCSCSACTNFPSSKHNYDKLPLHFFFFRLPQL